MVFTPVHPNIVSLRPAWAKWDTPPQKKQNLQSICIPWNFKKFVQFVLSFTAWSSLSAIRVCVRPHKTSMSHGHRQDCFLLSSVLRSLYFLSRILKVKCIVHIQGAWRWDTVTSRLIYSPSQGVTISHNPSTQRTSDHGARWWPASHMLRSRAQPSATWSFQNLNYHFLLPCNN